MKCEIEVLNITAQSLKYKLEILDSQMPQEIEEKFANQPEIINMAKSLWKDECNRDTAGLEEEWRGKEKWYEQQELECAEVGNTSHQPQIERNANNLGRVRDHTRQQESEFPSILQAGKSMQ